jgi:uncharacterized membrane protein YkvA (DUF1232 family)
MWWKAWVYIKMFRRDLLIMLIALKNPGTPKYVRNLMIAALVYLISPIDIIPDAIPVLGFVDDAVIVSIAVYGLMRLLPDYVRQESEEKAYRLGRQMPYLLIVISIVVFVWIFLMLYGLYSLLFK